VLLVTLAKRDAVRSYRVRLVNISAAFQSGLTLWFRAVLNAGREQPAPTRTLMRLKTRLALKALLVNPAGYTFRLLSNKDRIVAPQVGQTTVQFAPPPPPMYATLQGANMSNQHYYDYNGTFTGASSSTFRPNKRPRTLTEEEAAAITRNFSRGHFFVGSAAPVMIDPRLPVRLTLGEGDSVHFTIGPDALA
jgi:hypothetical protein